ncbi:MAG: polysaccharide pyruvyl transferase family protein [Anaerolineae bacterium]|jgi:hypothetical protein
MRIGIITYQRSVSYGAFLQTYALTRYLSDMGHDVQVIDYNPAHRDSRARPWSRRYGGLHPQNLVNLHKRWSFSAAIRRHLPLTERSYRTLDELRQDPPDMDAYICGSDQIWNPEHIGGGFDPAYFGCFGPPRVKRIAYAASIGAAHLPGQYHEAFRDCISSLDAISVREASACGIVQQLTGRDCERVVDPAFLISDYGELVGTERRSKGRFVLVYGLSHSPLLERAVGSATKELGLPAAYVVESFRQFAHHGQRRICSPGQWLSMFEQADAVVTDSFHGLVFALKLQKPFIAVGLPEAVQERNVRQMDLLKMLGLTERLVLHDRDLENEGLVTADIDWRNTMERMSDMVASARSYLARALG